MKNVPTNKTFKQDISFPAAPTRSLSSRDTNSLKERAFFASKKYLKEKVQLRLSALSSGIAEIEQT